MGVVNADKRLEFFLMKSQRQAYYGLGYHKEVFLYTGR